MSEELQLGITIDTKGSEAVGIIRKNLKEANGELVKAQALFGEYSAEAIAAAKKVAQFRDMMQEARETADLFDPGKRFQAFTGTLTTVAGGISAVQGAFGLLGAESKEIEKALLKVNSAIALSQGLSTIRDGAKDFQRLGTIIKMNVVSAFNSLKGAIGATGIGLLVIGIATLIQNFDKLKAVILNAFPALKNFGELFGNIVNKITDFIGITSQAGRALEAMEKSTKIRNEAIERQIKLLTAQGGKEKEIAEANRQLADNDIAVLKSKVDEKGRLYGEDAKKYKDLIARKQEIDLLEEKRLNEKAKTDAEKKKQENDAKIAQEEAFQNYLLKIEIEAYEKRKEKRSKSKNETIGIDGLTDSEREKQEKDKLERKEFFDKKYQDLSEKSEKSGLGKILEIRAKADMDSIKQAEDTAAAKQRIDELEKESKQATMYAIGDIVAGLSSIIGQETAAGKAIAVASATIDTYMSASTIFKQASKNPITVANPAYPYLMAAPAVLSGIARVKSIASVQVPKASGGSSVPSVSAAAPVAPTIPAAQTTNISRESINDLGNQAIRAYVVEKDVTSSQQRITAIRQRASFS